MLCCNRLIRIHIRVLHTNRWRYTVSNSRVHPSTVIVISLCKARCTAYNHCNHRIVPAHRFTTRPFAHLLFDLWFAVGFRVPTYDNDSVYNIMILRLGELLMYKDNNNVKICRHTGILSWGFPPRAYLTIFKTTRHANIWFWYAYGDGEDHFSRKRIFFFQQFWSGRNGISYSPRARWLFGYVHICWPLWIVGPKQRCFI